MVLWAVEPILIEHVFLARKAGLASVLILNVAGFPGPAMRRFPGKPLKQKHSWGPFLKAGVEELQGGPHNPHFLTLTRWFLLSFRLECGLTGPWKHLRGHRATQLGVFFVLI